MSDPDEFGARSEPDEPDDPASGRDPDDSSDLPPPPVGSRVQRIRYDIHAADLIAETLNATLERAPFQLPGATVWQLLVAGERDRPSALLTLWPSLRRADVIAGPVAIVFTDIAALDIVRDIEVQFRRGNGDYLILARGGKVIVRA